MYFMFSNKTEIAAFSEPILYLHKYLDIIDINRNKDTSLCMYL